MKKYIRFNSDKGFTYVDLYSIEAIVGFEEDGVQKSRIYPVRGKGLFHLVNHSADEVNETINKANETV